MKRSAGILPYRFRDGKLQVFLGHLGGPFWAKKRRSWGIIKGEISEGETPLEAAKREFLEETGEEMEGEFIDLGEVCTKNKCNHIFAIQADLQERAHSNEVHIRIGQKELTFPEIDRVRWMDLEEAKERIIASQQPFLERLAKLLKES